MESRSATVNTANPAAALVDPIYAEALKLAGPGAPFDGAMLADAARGYFDGPGIAERAQLLDTARTATALESLRITTRLIAIVSWGLLQQAIRNGEVAAHADRRLSAPDADVALDLLPARARGLAGASRDLSTRAHAADTALAA